MNPTKMCRSCLIIIRRSPFAPKNRFFSRMKCHMERFNPVKIFRNRRNAWPRCFSFFVSTEMTGISCTICKNITRVILSPTVDDFVDLGTSRPSLPSSTGSFLVQHRILTRFDRKKQTVPFVPKIPPENSMQMVSAHTFLLF